MERFEIHNRHGSKIVVVVEKAEPSKGLAFVMHGLGGYKEQPHILKMTQAFVDSGYTIVTFDVTNSIGESGGKYEDATVTSYLGDLEDVITWAAAQTWYQELFILCGHSLGSIASALYASQNSKKVKALAPISAVVSGELSLRSHQYEEKWQQWQQIGWLQKPAKTDPRGKIHQMNLPWSHMEDRLKYNLLKVGPKLTMPVLLIVGDADKSTPLNDQELFYETIAGPKELFVIPGAEHSFKQEHEREQLYTKLIDWVRGL